MAVMAKCYKSHSTDVALFKDKESIAPQCHSAWLIHSAPLTRQWSYQHQNLHVLSSNPSKLSNDIAFLKYLKKELQVHIVMCVTTRVLELLTTNYTIISCHQILIPSNCTLQLLMTRMSNRIETVTALSLTSKSRASVLGPM